MFAGSTKLDQFQAHYQDFLRRVLGLALLFGLALALTLIPLPVALFLVVSSIIGLLVLIRPQYALYLLIFAIPFRSVREFQLGGLSITATEVLSLLLVIAWIARQIRCREPLLQRLELGGAIGLFLGALVLSTLASGSLKQSVKVIAEWGEFAVAYGLTTMLFQRSLQFWGLIAGLLMASASEATLGLVQVFYHIGPASFIKGGVLAAYGTFDQPNPYGGFLNYTFPIALSLALFTQHPLIRRASYLLLLVIAAGLVASLSRGAWLGALGAIAVVLGSANRRGTLLVWLGIVAAIWMSLFEALALLPFSIMQRVLTAVGLGNVDINHVTPENFSPVERLAHWIAGLSMFATHPLLGVGIGNFPEFYDQYRLPMWKDALGHAHNYYINIAAETGLVGLLAYLCLLVSAFLLAHRTIALARQMLTVHLADFPFQQFRVSQGKQSLSLVQPRRLSGGDFTLVDYFAVSIGLLGGLTAVSIHNLVDNLYVHGMTIELGFLLGALTLVSRRIQLYSTEPAA